MTGAIFLEDGELSIGEVDGVILVPIVRSGDSSGAVTIQYTTQAVSAADGTDYTGDSGFVTMDAGSNRVVVPITILDDDASEATETFVFTLVGVDSGELRAPRTSRIDILDDENPVVEQPEPPFISDYEVTREVAFDNLDQPMTIKFSPVDSSLAYIVLKKGQIHIHDMATGDFVGEFLDIRDKVNHGGGRGLMDIAFHPDFESTPYVYAYYVVDPPDTAGKTESDGPDGVGNRFAYLVRFEADPATNYQTILADSETILLGAAGQTLADISGNGTVVGSSDENVPASDIDPTTGEFIDDYLKVDSAGHAAGQLAFGPDGMLYVSTGDGGAFNFVDDRVVGVQSLDSLAGKILRIDPITGQGLADNPFVEVGDSLTANKSKVYQLGLRNPFSIGFHDDGRLFISDTGWFTFEELNTGAPGANFGWPFFEGGDGGVLARAPGYEDLPEAPAFYADVDAGNITLTPPFRAFHHSTGEPGFQFQAITGGDVFYDGSQYPDEFQNDYFFTDYSDGEVFSVDVNDRRDIKYLYTVDNTSENFGPIHHTRGPDGFVYSVDFQEGTIERLLIEGPPDPVVSGDLMRWHRITVDFEGPDANEAASTFRDFRFDVTFTHTETGTEMRVPGFFAADGNAAESGASSGNIWRAHFNPPLTGEWTYTASLRTGTDIAASTDPFAGTPVGGINGQSGSFDVVETDKTGADFRAKGMLTYVDEHYLMHAGDGSYFIKAGADSPENFLAFADFDGTEPSHTYTPHVGDWVPGDPTWGNDQGKGIIGAVNYLASEGLNSIYFVTMNVQGDGRDVWPWTADDQRSVFDVSKLDQWEIVFQHMDAKGLMLHVVTQEVENNNLLNNGDLGVERAIYYRELMARFGHHNGVTWNLGEENRNTDAQRKDFANYFEAVDPYGHLTVVHTWPFEQDEVYPGLLGFDSFDGASLQVTDPRAELRSWIEQSEDAGRPWVVSWDETGPPSVGVPSDGTPGAEEAHADLRNRLWQTLTAGGAGVEWYFGAGSTDGDLTTEDFRTRDSVWDWTVKATSFFANNDLPLTEMGPMDEATPQGDDFIFAKAGEVYVIYQPDGGQASLDLNGFQGTFVVSWYNPREPGGLIASDVISVDGGSVVSLGSPPPGSDGDWAILVRRIEADVVSILNGTEDQNLTPSQQDFLDQFAQLATGTALTEIIVAAVPENGMLLLNGGDVQMGQTIPLAELGNLLFQPDQDFNGATEFRWQPVDAGGPIDAEMLLQLSLAPVNDDPVAVDDGVLIVNADETNLISNALLLANDQDIDGDLLTIVSVGAAMNGQVGLQQAAVNFVPTPGYTGVASFTYTLEDAAGVQDTAEVTLQVVQNTTTEHSLAANSGLSGAGARDWGDGVTVEAFQADGSPGQVFFNSGGIGVEGDRNDREVGFQGDTQTSQSLLLTFDGGANDIVLRIGLLNPTEFNGLPETGRWIAFDSLGQQIGTGLIGPNQGTTLDQFTYSIPVNVPDRIFSLRLEATGYNHGAFPDVEANNSDFNLEQIDFVKSSGSGNQAPIVIGQLADATIDEESSFDYATAGAFFDLEDDQLTFAAEITGGAPLPAWLTIDSQTGQLRGMPDDDDVGPLDLTIRASDGLGQASTTLNVTVQPINDAPIAFDQEFIASPDQPANSNVGRVAADDPDAGDVLSFSITGGNEFGIFDIDALTGDITLLQPNLIELGTIYDLTVEVADNAIPSLSDSANVLITGAPLPGSFDLSITATATIVEDGASVPLVTVTRSGDISQAALVDYSITGDVDGADLQGMLAGTISFAAGQSQQVLPISVFADLRSESDEDLTITVSGHPTPPTPSGAFDWSALFDGQSPNGLARKYDLPSLAADALVIDLSQTSQAQFTLDPDQDAVFIGGAAEDMPHRFKVVGGRDIVFLGGTFIATSPTSSTLRFDDVYGSVFIDGLHVDNAAVFGQDAIVVGGADGTAPDVTLQNILVENIGGSIEDGEHGDVFQPQGPIGDLKVYNLTGSSNYQGFFLQEQPDRSGAELDSAHLENVNLRHTPGDHFTSILLFLGEVYPTTLENVFVTQKDGQQAEDRSVFPFSTSPNGAVRTDDTITWPLLPVTGEVEVGTPPGGDFVKPENVGGVYVPDLSGVIGTINGAQATITIQDDDDLDNDGFGIGDGDLDDDDPTIFPGAPELVDDGKDNDGDGDIDEHLGGPAPLAGIADREATVGDDVDFLIPAPLFGDPDEPFGDILSLQARQSNGDPLPAWLSFDPLTGRFSGQPQPGDADNLSLIVEALDLVGNNSTVGFSLTVFAGPNIDPVAVDDSGTTQLDTVLRIAMADLLADDSDPNGDPLSIDSVGNPTLGTVEIDGTDVVFTPAAGQIGEGGFDYTISDGRGGTDTARVDVEIIEPPPNADPVAVDDSGTTPVDTALRIAIADLLADDSDPDGDPLTFDGVSNPSLGTVQVDGTDVVFTPAAGQIGEGGFDYTISDGRGGTASARVDVEITDPPIPSETFTLTPDNSLDGGGEKPWDHGVTIEAFNNDGSPGAIKFNGGQLSVNGGRNNKQLDYDGATQTSEAFVLKFEDGAKNIILGLGRMNASESNGLPETGLWEAYDANGILLATGQLDPNDATNVARHEYDFSLDFPDVLHELRIEATGYNNGERATQTGNNSDFSLRSLTFDTPGGPPPPNIDPIAVADSGSTEQDTALRIAIADLLADDSDPNGDPLTFDGVSNPTLGTVEIDGTDVVFTPTAGQTGEGGFDYMISDGRGGTASARVDVEITEPPPNVDPVAVDDSGTTEVDTALRIAIADLLADDSDPDGDPLTFDGVSNPTLGTVAVDGTDVVFTPAAGQTGEGGFDYTISDGRGGSDSARVDVEIAEPPPNVDPVAVDDSGTTPVDTVLRIAIADLLADDSDPDGDPLTFDGVGNPTLGTVAVDGTDVVFTPAAGQIGEGGFDYTISDGRGGTDTARVDVEITDISIPSETFTLTPDNSLDGGGEKPWDHGVTIEAFNNDGGPGAIKFDGGQLSVNGGRNNKQIDYDGATQTSEAFVLKFEDGAKNIVLGLGRMNASESNGLPETGLWQAFNANGVLLATGQLDPNDATNVARHEYDFSLDFPDVLHELRIEATGYNNGERATQTGNNSDFSLRSLTFDTPGGPPPPNQEPVAVDDSATAQQDIALRIAIADLLADDSDPDGDPLSLDAVSNPALGTVAIDGTDVVFTPAAGQTGEGGFDYTISDGRGGTDTARVDVEIVEPPPNIDPVAVDDSGTTQLDTVLRIAMTDLLADDSDANGDPLSIDSVGNPTLGTVEIDGTDVVFTPAAGQTGEGGFDYTISDGRGGTDTARVDVEITDTLPLTTIILEAIESLDGSGERAWSDGVSLQAFDYDGSPGAINYHRGELSVDGGRNNRQLDYDGSTQTSESFVLSFEQGAQNVILGVGRMNPSEQDGLPETGQWEAYDDNGLLLASGRIDPNDGIETSKYEYDIDIDYAGVIHELKIEATGYGNGQLASDTGNNSDFSLRTLTFDTTEEPLIS